MSPMTSWKLGQYVRIWRNGYEYGHIETIEAGHVELIGGHLHLASTWSAPQDRQVTLVGDDGKEIYCRVKDLEEGE